ncbi:restriction endonuclease subunit S [Pseudomonas sp. MF6754]|uniref:restriction endonuclease subunit S n=1 Tax=Pseudomonas sp. MF6754 TaxID=2797529 RepID=UPI00190BA921|nr:restriction endonuclease subunit S [Pseudomonas sp. MF6754]MBK3455754.1 restriction endonuclease subunit S [Pseudomonas sp. MF6754]
MSSEWVISELGKEAINASRPFSFKQHPNVVFVNTGDVLNGSFLHSDVSCGKGLPGQAKKALQQHDILLTEIRPGNRRFAYVDFDARKYVVSTKFMVIESLGRVSPRFLYHVLTNQSALNSFQRIAESRSGTFPQITFDSIAHYPVPVPPDNDQQKLVEFLDALDQRITLLHETNATLEAIAQALFKSWFVDFDPARAKAEGLEPEGMDAATAALFPDSFEESELGLVPRGWQICSILDIANLLSGGTPKTDRAEYWGGDIPWASAKDVSQAANTILTGTDRTITALGLQKSATRMIPAFSTVVVARGATTGRMVMFGMSMAMNQTCYALESKAGTPVALYLVLKKEIDALTQKAHGSVFDTITTSTFSASKTLQIPDALLACFESVAGPLFRRILAGTQQANTLTQLRNTLLPRLISGQLRLAEAEANVENALSEAI